MRALLVIAAGMILPSPASSDALLDRMKANLLRVNDYKCEAVLNARLAGAGVSNMRMTVYYKRPNRVKVEAKEGFAVLPEDGLYVGNPVEEMLKRFKLKALGPAAFSGKPCQKYAATPLPGEQTPVGNLRLFVHRQLAVPVGVTGQSDEGKLETKFEYRQFEGYWLPVETSLKVEQPAADPRSRQGPRSGTASLKFSNYKINTGLPDSLFVRPEKSQKTRKTK